MFDAGELKNPPWGAPGKAFWSRSALCPDQPALLGQGDLLLPGGLPGAFQSIEVHAGEIEIRNVAFQASVSFRRPCAHAGEDPGPTHACIQKLNLAST